MADFWLAICFKVVDFWLANYLKIPILVGALLGNGRFSV